MDLINNPNEVGGFDENGDPKDVEIDESLFFKRKYNSAGGLFGSTERGSCKCFMIRVQERNAKTPFPIIGRYLYIQKFLTKLKNRLSHL